MIYAPPSREKSKQTMRSPLMDKNTDEYLMSNGGRKRVTVAGKSGMGMVVGGGQIVGANMSAASCNTTKY